MKNVYSRRRIISILAAAAGTSMLPSPSFAAVTSPATYWNGMALGAEASLTLQGIDAVRSREAIRATIDEIARLEKIFSLFMEDSALSVLNRDGVLPTPPLDLVMCLTEARHISLITNGAFDVSVQPLWVLYSKHFEIPTADPSGPSQSDIEIARSLVDFNNISITTDKITLNRPGMALTLNGIAQGYITDRVADLLRSYGFDHVLINMGETRALGSKLDGVPWNIKINNTNEVLPLADQAIATSGGYGTPFGATGQHHHLFSPGTGRSTSLWTSMSVIAPTATMADGLSTGLSALTEQDISRISTEHNVSVYAYNADYKWSSQPDS